jgi:uncharacterized protein YbjT (DUF2867 family)
MQKHKTIFVTGATGNQGGATLRHLLSAGFRVKALLRNPSSEAGKKLIHPNVEIIKGDLNEPQTYKHHLDQVDAVFCNLSFKHGVDKELNQGINLVNSAKENKVQFFLYSSVIGCDANTGIPHWESKFKLEKHLKKSGMAFSIIRPSSLYENLLIPEVNKRIKKGKLVLPTNGNKEQQFISADDIGKIATAIFSNPEKYAGKTMTVAAEQMDGVKLAAVLSKALDKTITYQKLPMIITRLVMGKDLTKMFRWINENDALFVKDISVVRNEFPGMLSLEQWIKTRFL